MHIYFYIDSTCVLTFRHSNTFNSYHALLNGKQIEHTKQFKENNCIYCHLNPQGFSCARMWMFKATVDMFSYDPSALSCA